MFRSKKEKLKEKRRFQYETLNSLFREKHNIIGNWFVKKYGLGMVTPYDGEGEEYRKKLKSFFSDKYGELPKSYNSFANVGYGFPDFDPTPLEKLQELYDQMEIVFPEPFLKKHRKEKLKKLNETN